MQTVQPRSHMGSGPGLLINGYWHRSEVVVGNGCVRYLSTKCKRGLIRLAKP